jgi:hypothetical protein
MERCNSVGVLGYDPRRDEVILIYEFRPGALAAGDTPFFDPLVAGTVGTVSLRSRRPFAKWRRKVVWT